VAGTLGILVAGGRGTRLGLGVPKALAPWAGGTLLSRALATLRECCDDVVVAAPRDLALPVPDAQRAFDPPGAAGPLAGLVAGLASRPWARALALGVDLPLVSGSLLRALGERLAPHAAAAPAPGGRLQPLAAWYAPAALAPLAAALARGERALVPAVAALAPWVADDAALAALGAGPREFLNVNTPADLAEAVRAAGAGAGA
jgi:molybdopterin-guanine dinucleotide biosynthesis protein A